MYDPLAAQDTLFAAGSSSGTIAPGAHASRPHAFASGREFTASEHEPYVDAAVLGARAIPISRAGEEAVVTAGG
jgi:hypothetical protein